ncbi:uncharacterized protein LOC106142693 isoform X2 [Amyelois transitella]|uniref:uncharacterized protein LOC106142693 isoform X2 n=1 Tax=Amyelois transitella TaxID=680683 RepID=UPI00298FEB38|nr:uncharacterized protein LOC106142693 isoform X2 [Amyelois transitella]
MADDDEIDVLGEFSFNSCFAQNNQGIPSCSNREDTVHPQWLLDSTATNCEKRIHQKPPKNKSIDRDNNIICAEWTREERKILLEQMDKYGRDVRKISQTLKTKTEAEIQALIEAEHGINLETPTFGLDKNVDHDNVPVVVQEEVVMDTTPKSPRKIKSRRKYTISKNSLLKPVIVENRIDAMDIDPGELVYEDDLMLGSTESIGSDLDLTDVVSKRFQKAKVGRKMGNHRRKTSGSDRGRPRNKSKDILKSPQGRQRKDSSLSEDSMKSPKMQIVLGTGQTLPVSEGEQVIKIEKKKDSEPESDIEVDIDSDNEDGSTKKCSMDAGTKTNVEEAPIAVPIEGRKFEPMRKRARKINLDGGGGYTIMHTLEGDLLETSAEPRRPPRRAAPPVPLVRCRVYNAERPAPFDVRLYVSALISMDVHAHTSRGEVMGLLGGTWSPALLAERPAVCGLAYRPAGAAAGSTHCDMDPVSQSSAAESLRAQGLSVVAWHHSHPAFPPAPSAQDLRSQRALQALGPRLLALITAQHWPAGRAASQYRCIRVEDDDLEQEVPTGYQLSVKLVADITIESLPLYLEELAGLLGECERDSYSVDVTKDICPQAKMTYLDKCLSSISHHMRSAGYADDDPVVPQLLQGIRDIFR